MHSPLGKLAEKQNITTKITQEQNYSALDTLHTRINNKNLTTGPVMVDECCFLCCVKRDSAIKLENAPHKRRGAA